MKIEDLTKEELENMSYDDIAFMVLNEQNKPMKIIDLFNEIGKLVSLSAQTIEEKIGDFFEMLTLDKRFIMLDDGTWDLSSKHAKKLVLDEDEEEIAVDEEELTEEDEEEEQTEENIFYDEQDDDNDDDDGLSDLVVIDEDEEEETNL